MHERQRQRCVVRYHVGTYSGEEVVYCWDDDDDGDVIRRARRQLRRAAGTWGPMWSESFCVVERDDYDGD